VVQHLARRIASGQRAPVRVVSSARKSPRTRANKQAGKSALRPVHEEGCGFEMIGGKRIPFVHTQGGKDYWVTTYGSHDATDHAFVREEKIGGKIKIVHGTTLLVRHDRRGQSSWGTVCNGRQSISGKVANKLQDIIDTREGDWLISAVSHLRRVPEALYDTSGEYTSAKIILYFIGRDIAGGHTRYTEMLAKVIEAQEIIEGDTAARLQESIGQKASIAARIIDALRVCANRLGRVPTKTEVRKEYMDHVGQYVTNGDFSKEIAKAGLAWLPVRV
jgi:hypothetical protein